MRRANQRPIARDPCTARMTTRLSEGARRGRVPVLRRFADFTLLEVRIGTGGHQIRVHLASIKHPAVETRCMERPRSRCWGDTLHAHRIRSTLDGRGW